MPRSAPAALRKLPPVSEQMPAGWGATEFAASLAREALDDWDDPRQDHRLDRGMALAATMRRLLAELDADRAARHE